MRGLLFLIAIVPLALMLAAQFKSESDRVPTEKEQIVSLLEDMTFNTPRRIQVLLNEDRLDKEKRQRIKTIILKTDEEYLPKSQRIVDKAPVVLDILRKDLAGHDFGTAVGDKASYFRWLTSDAEWTLSSVETSNGHYSRWEGVGDIYQLRAE